MELEKHVHVHVHIGNHLGFHEHQIAWAITMVDKLVDGTRFTDLFTSYEMELETHVHVQIEKLTRVSWTTIAC